MIKRSIIKRIKTLFTLRAPDFGFRIPIFQLPTSNFRPRTPDFGLPTSHFQLPTSISLHLSACLAGRWTLSFLLLFSCVPTKKITYLQYGDEKKDEKPYDQVTRTYDLKKEPYRLQPEDIISLRVASVTGDEYNFIKEYEVDLGIIRKLNQYEDNMQNQGSNSTRNIGIGTQGVGTEGNASTLGLDRQSTGFVLDKNGELELPKIGALNLAGLTIPEAEMKVKGALEGYFETPMVRIQLLNFHFTIIGEVNNEGRYTSYDPEMTVFDAISLAGNLSEYADRTNIKIIRKENGEAQVIYLNILDESSLNAENYFLRKGDMIIVPALEARTAQQYTLPNTARTLGIVSAALSLSALIISLSK